MRIKTEIRFVSFLSAMLLVVVCCRCCCDLLFIKEKSRFSVKFQTFWWKLSRFYCWKKKENKMKGIASSTSSSLNLVCHFTRFFQRLCKFMKMFQLHFSKQIHKQFCAMAMLMYDVKVQAKMNGKIYGPYWPLNVSFLHDFSLSQRIDGGWNLYRSSK